MSELNVYFNEKVLLCCAHAYGKHKSDIIHNVIEKAVSCKELLNRYDFYNCLIPALPCVELQTTALTQGLERIPDQIGYLVISEDGVLAVSY